jgi:hypothetical protein
MRVEQSNLSGNYLPTFHQLGLTTAILDRLLYQSEVIPFGEETDNIRMEYRNTLFFRNNAALS